MKLVVIFYLFESLKISFKMLALLTSNKLLGSSPFVSVESSVLPSANLRT